jgi:TetR/AcrR family transcriptional repressor of nem operon
VPRPRAFDPDTVLDKALELFWLRGYEATSLDDLTEVMGLGRGSLYNEFGDKHSLFLRALDRYGALRLSEMERALESASSVRAGIAGLLRDTVVGLWSDPRRRGCLLVNSTTELAASDPAVAMRATQAFERTVAVLASTLERGTRSGELRPDLEIRATARYLASALNSLRLLVKTTDREVANDVVDLTLKSLD